MLCVLHPPSISSAPMKLVRLLVAHIIVIIFHLIVVHIIVCVVSWINKVNEKPELLSLEFSFLFLTLFL